MTGKVSHYDGQCACYVHVYADAFNVLEWHGATIGHSNAITDQTDSFEISLPSPSQGHAPGGSAIYDIAAVGRLITGVSNTCACPLAQTHSHTKTQRQSKSRHQYVQIRLHSRLWFLIFLISIPPYTFGGACANMISCLHSS